MNETKKPNAAKIFARRCVTLTALMNQLHPDQDEPSYYEIRNAEMLVHMFCPNSKEPLEDVVEAIMFTRKGR